ncbi:TPA: triose-phosphate isomerase [Candidatus Poribacteria bacterium]|jgi:triosephosphate isomerase|nr:triose-phosphate isomerase [Candidatus Poribacteria bacterium]HIA70554.1 triose-phosphate isomerase [Candidatus Poribacteria bacterium]HIB85662.1 triose-phosphate isomerase [Candidatus Poribacteria bacterium]HIC02535.1 triose-phosphate isomerase [Candidatus Poribacteria bacterium]HIC18066.1 triose-phosphate isomerase [Candidatus Poribacteria bacterium]
MRKPIIAGNWKLNKTISQAVDLVTELQALVADVSEVEIVVAPVFTALSAVAAALKENRIGLSAQDLYWEKSGAFTGEVSAELLRDAGCSYVIIGHSERRQYFGENNEMVNKKVRSALDAHLAPIICVGEHLAERQAGKTESVIEDHVMGAIEGLSANQLLTSVIAYEPVWAIGTGQVATPDQAQEVHAHIRRLLAGKYSKEVANQIQIQYGGSVKPANATDLLSQVDVDGALVGGASLEAESFAGIIAAARRN